MCQVILIFRTPFHFQYITEWKGEIQVGKLWNILQISRDLRDALAKILPAPMRESMALDVLKITRSRHSTFLKFTITRRHLFAICYKTKIFYRVRNFLFWKKFSLHISFLYFRFDIFDKYIAWKILENLFQSDKYWVKVTLEFCSKNKKKKFFFKEKIRILYYYLTISYNCRFFNELLFT